MPALCLHIPKSFRRHVFLEECRDLGVELGAQGAEGGGVAIAAGALLDVIVNGLSAVIVCHRETAGEDPIPSGSMFETTQ